MPKVITTRYETHDIKPYFNRGNFGYGALIEIGVMGVDEARKLWVPRNPEEFENKRQKISKQTPCSVISIKW